MGSMGSGPPPLIFPYIESLLKDLSVDFFDFSLRQILLKLGRFSHQTALFCIENYDNLYDRRNIK